MPDGYLVQLGDGSLDSGDSISVTQTTFTTDSVIGAGEWAWSGTTNLFNIQFDNEVEQGQYELGTDGNVYFVLDPENLNFSQFSTITSASVEGAPSFTLGDGVVSGTGGDDLIDDNYSDTDGDQIDNGDGAGPSGNADVVEAGGGNDTIASGDGDDTVRGQGGNDEIDGGGGNDDLDGGGGNDSVSGQAGNDSLQGRGGNDFLQGGTGDDTATGGSGDDTIYGDDAPTDGRWDYEVYDYNFDSSDFQAFDIENGSLSGSGQTDGFDSTALVNDARGSSGNPSDFGVVYTSRLLADEDGTYTFSLTSDDGSTIRILDENGDPLTWLNEDGGTDAFMDNDRHQASTERSGEVTLEAGRIYTIEVRHWENEGQQVISGEVTLPDGTTENLADSGLILGPETAAAGNDSLSGGDGDDQVFGNGGDDTIDGGRGADTVYGGLGRDEITVAEGDAAYGGDGDDLFVLGDLNETGSSSITITGGEGDETAGDTLRLSTDIGQGDITFTNTDDSDGGLSGTFTMTDGTVVDFSEIENIICFTPGTRILTETGERPIETLRTGDRIVTRDSGVQPIRWIGRSTVPGQGKFAPVAIDSPVLGGARRPLLVSPQHRVLFGGYKAELLCGAPEVLVSARHLVDNLDVRVAPREWITYFHLMLDRHEVIFAEGAATESFHANDLGVAAISPRARAEMFDAFPHLRADLRLYGDTARRCLKTHEARLLRSSAALKAA